MQIRIDNNYTIEKTAEGFLLKGKEQFLYKTSKLALQKYFDLSLNEDNFEEILKNQMLAEEKLKRKRK